MLGAMIVLLQRKALAWLDNDAFDLLAIVDRLIAAPGPVYFEVPFR
jgi:hypothetical protein